MGPATDFEPMVPATAEGRRSFLVQGVPRWPLLDSTSAAAQNAAPPAHTPTPIMRFGINAFLFVSPFVTASAKLFSQFKKWGFETVEIPVEDPSHIDPAAVKAAAAKAGIAVGSLCACMGPGRDLRGTVAEQKTATDYVKTL